MYQGKYASGEKAAPASRPPKTPKAPKGKATLGTKIFYSIYAVIIVLFAVALAFALKGLNGWLVNYEASQPDKKAEQVFTELFSNPDWEDIYTRAKLEDTKFESKAAYKTYMTEKVGTTALTYTKTSAGLTGGQKYIVKLGEEKIATFTLTNSITSELEIPNWELNTVEAFLKRTNSVTVCTQPGRKIQINGVALDDSYIVQTTSTAAENYLPDGVYGARSATFYVDGLLITPTVTATDAAGKTVELVYDAATNTYTETVAPQTIDEDLKTQLINAAQTYCKFMINAPGTELSLYFDTKSAIYKSITRNEMWIKGYSGYKFDDVEVVDYYRYSDDLFSARVSLVMKVTRANGTVKEFSLNNTFFLKKQSNGKWLVNEMTNVNIQEVKTKVQLTYMLDGQVLLREMVDASSNSLVPPTVTVPKGQVFSGWFRETVDENGDATLKLMFSPDENGKVTLPAEYTLQPMTLQALFKNEGA